MKTFVFIFSIIASITFCVNANAYEYKKMEYTMEFCEDIIPHIMEVGYKCGYEGSYFCYVKEQAILSSSDLYERFKDVGHDFMADAYKYGKEDKAKGADPNYELIHIISNVQRTCGMALSGTPLMNDDNEVVGPPSKDGLENFKKMKNSKSAVEMILGK